MSPPLRPRESRTFMTTLNDYFRVNYKPPNDDELYMEVTYNLAIHADLYLMTDNSAAHRGTTKGMRKEKSKNKVGKERVVEVESEDKENQDVDKEREQEEGAKEGGNGNGIGNGKKKATPMGQGTMSSGGGGGMAKR